MRLNWGTAPFSLFDVLEICLTLLCLGIALARPAMGMGCFARIEGILLRVSRRPWVCAVILFAFPIVFRCLLLPVYGPPVPFISDEYAYLLQADTFASGRLTNPSPPLPQHFASVYVLAQPTYTAEYQVGQGLMLALGQVATGVPWAGVMLSMGLMCALIYWALRAWMPDIWAFVGTATIVDVQWGVLSYWMNSYWGGCVPAIGGALALGALPRMRERNRVFFSFVAAAGLIILINSRPLEGVLLTLVAACALVYWTVISRELSWSALVGRVVPSLVLSFAAAVAFAGYYNYSVTGKATEFPYLLYRSEYGLPQGFFWQKPVVMKTALPTDIRAEYEDQLRQHERRTSFKALVGATGGKLRRVWEFYVGVPLTVALVFLPFIWRGRNMGLAFWPLVVVIGLDNMLFFAFFPHYAGAVAVLIVVALAQCVRNMRASGPAGLFLSRSVPLVCVLGLLVPMCGRVLEGSLPAALTGAKKLWASEFFHEVSRERFVPQLERENGGQLVLVRYRPYDGEKKTEWIYNGADLERAKIIWARESGDAESDRRLIRQFSGRTVWLAEPDAKPPRITPYHWDKLPAVEH